MSTPTYSYFSPVRDERKYQSIAGAILGAFFLCCKIREDLFFLSIDTTRTVTLQAGPFAFKAVAATMDFDLSFEFSSDIAKTLERNWRGGINHENSWKGQYVKTKSSDNQWHLSFQLFFPNCSRTHRSRNRNWKQWCKPCIPCTKLRYCLVSSLLSSFLLWQVGLSLVVFHLNYFREVAYHTWHFYQRVFLQIPY